MERALEGDAPTHDGDGVTGSTVYAGALASRSRRVALAAAVSAALLWSTFSGVIVRSLPGSSALPDVPYLHSIVASATDVVVMVLLVAVVGTRSVRAALAGAGVGPLRGIVLAWSAALFAPAVLFCTVAVAPAADLQWPDLLWKGVAGPVTEELVYRGLAVSALVRLCGWRLLPACLWPALFFGIGHLSQGADAASVTAIVAITAAGGLLFGWLFVRWEFDLWPPGLLHVGMNTLWLVSDLGETAIGGWAGNALRATIVALAVLSTVRLTVPGPTDRDDRPAGARPRRAPSGTDGPSRGSRDR